jgi:hypothetical protein
MCEIIGKTFKGIIGKDTGTVDLMCVVWPDSKAVLGTGKAVKVSGTVDGYEFNTALLPTGMGPHMLPIKAAIRKAINKTMGDEVEIYVRERL